MCYFTTKCSTTREFLQNELHKRYINVCGVFLFQKLLKLLYDDSSLRKICKNNYYNVFPERINKIQVLSRRFSAQGTACYSHVDSVPIHPSHSGGVSWRHAVLCMLWAFTSEPSTQPLVLLTAVLWPQTHHAICCYFVPWAVGPS